MTPEEIEKCIIRVPGLWQRTLDDIRRRGSETFEEMRDRLQGKTIEQDLPNHRQETSSPDSIICPWCFHRHDPELIYSLSDTGCRQCGKPFEYRTETTYFAKPVETEKP